LHAFARHVVVGLGLVIGPASGATIIYRNPEPIPVPRSVVQEVTPAPRPQRDVVDLTRDAAKDLARYGLNGVRLPDQVRNALRQPTVLPGVPDGFALVLYLRGAGKRPFRIDFTRDRSARRIEVTAITPLRLDDPFFLEHEREARLAGGKDPLWLTTAALRHATSGALVRGDIHHALEHAIGLPILGRDGDFWVVGLAPDRREIELHYRIENDEKRITRLRVVTESVRNHFVSVSGRAHESVEARTLRPTRGRFMNRDIRFGFGIEQKIGVLHDVTRAEVLEALESDFVLVTNDAARGYHSTGAWFIHELRSGRNLLVALSEDDFGVMRVLTAYEPNNRRVFAYGRAIAPILILRSSRTRAHRRSVAFAAAHAPAWCDDRLRRGMILSE
jgi:hypothetical protein